MKTYAPILLFVYNRPEHLKQLIASLQANAEAAQSLLFIYTDAARNKADEEQVNKVREVIRHIDGFASIEVIERATNWGLARNIIGGVTEQIRRYGRVIVLEDDLVVAPYFLRFMNDALEAYKDEPQVGHIQACDFTQDASLPDTFLIKFTGSWGWATWADRWADVDWELSSFGAFCSNPANIKRLNLNGDDRFLRLYRQTQGNGTSWSVRFGMHLVKNDWLTVYPRYSYIENIGCDASGVHSTAEDADKMAVDLDRAIKDPNPVPVTADPTIQSIMKKHYSDGLLSTLKRRAATAWYVHQVKRAHK